MLRLLSTPEAAKKSGLVPDEPAKIPCHTLTVKAARGSSNIRHERNRIRGTVTIISTVFTSFFRSSIT
jgi:hypothetical protein